MNVGMIPAVSMKLHTKTCEMIVITDLGTFWAYLGTYLGTFWAYLGTFVPTPGDILGDICPHIKLYNYSLYDSNYIH